MCFLILFTTGIVLVAVLSVVALWVFSLKAFALNSKIGQILIQSLFNFSIAILFL